MHHASAPSHVEIQTSAADPVLSTVEALRRPGVLADAVAQEWCRTNQQARVRSVAILSLHYKPFKRARLVAAATVTLPDGTESPRPQYFFVQVYPTRARARRRVEEVSKSHLKCLGPAVFVLPEYAAVVWSLPNGPRLRNAKVGFHERQLRKFLCKLAKKRRLPREVVPNRLRMPVLVRYVPRRRALLRLDPIKGLLDRAAFLKVYSPTEFASALQNLKLVQQAAETLEFTTPRLFVSSKRRRAVLMDALPGTSFTEVSTTRTSAFAPVGRAVASLHNARLTTGARWEPAVELRGLITATDDIQLALPEIAQQIATATAELVRRGQDLSFDEYVPIHGNLFADQLLVEGSNVGLVDWDDLCHGDPMYDLGRLLAHLQYLAIVQSDLADHVRNGIAQLLSAYLEERGKPIAVSRLEWHTQVALLLRAKISGLRPLVPAWHEHVARTVAVVERSLSEGLDSVRRAFET